MSTDLHLRLDPTLGKARAVESALRAAIADGRLPVGARVPPTRALAADLGIARNSVAAAYGQLIEEGMLLGRAGAGTYVNRSAHMLRSPQAASSEIQAPRLDLRPGSPDVSTFPRALWLRAQRRSLAKAPDLAFDYGDDRGISTLRDELARYLARARGVQVSPGNLVIVNGYREGRALLAGLFARSNMRRIALEDPCLPSAREAWGWPGLETTPIAVDDFGARVEELDLADVQGVVLTPAHHFPYGGALSQQRRLHVARWAERTQSIVVEDDYDGEFRFDRQPVGALQSLSLEHVIYAGTTSKSLAPALRLGWLALPDRFVAPFVEAKRVLTGGVSVLTQLAFTELLASGDFDRHVRRMRREYRRRRDYLLATLQESSPNLRVHGIAAGLHAVIDLPPGVTEERFLAQAAASGIGVHGLSRYTDSPRAPALVVGFGTPSPAMYSTAVRVLADELAQARMRV